MTDKIYKFSGVIKASPSVTFNELSECDREVAEQENFEIGVELIDIADYDPDCGETLREWALLNEFHEQVAIDVLDHFSISVLPDEE